MTFNQLLNAVPLTFKCVGLADHYEFWCRQCSYKELYGFTKKRVRSSEWQSEWQLKLSEKLENHQAWHSNNPGKSYEEEQKKMWKEVSDQASRELNKLFSRMNFRI